MEGTKADPAVPPQGDAQRTYRILIARTGRTLLNWFTPVPNFTAVPEVDLSQVAEFPSRHVANRVIELLDYPVKLEVVPFDWPTTQGEHMLRWQIALETRLSLTGSTTARLEWEKAYARREA